MKRTWTQVGAAEGFRPEPIARAIAQLEWQPLPCELGMMPALGIEQAIKQLRIPKVTHVAVSNELAPYGLYGIRGHYTNGTAQVYVMDRGSDIVVVCSELF